MISILSMLSKQVYTKTIAISEVDMEFIKKMRAKKVGNRTSMAGVLSHIINIYKLKNDK